MVDVRVEPRQRYVAVVIVCGSSLLLGLGFFCGEELRFRSTAWPGLSARQLGLLRITVLDLMSWFTAIETELLLEAAVFLLAGYLPDCGCVPGGASVPFLGLE